MAKSPARMVLLYGPPGSGKSALTRALGELDPQYCHFRWMMLGGGHGDVFRVVTRDQLDFMRATAREVLWETKRDGVTYAVDQSHIRVMTSKGLIPVIEVGQLKAVEAIVAALPDVLALVVSLVTAGHESTALPGAHLTFDLGAITPGDAALEIDYA